MVAGGKMVATTVVVRVVEVVEGELPVEEREGVVRERDSEAVA